ncbi:hypothetical protein B0T14DRAFT_290891 [Immersiella caudata]|uniref:Uncharacterized protein n=1 Tax=Immersiella caudata TaxID=314043 RepID=A0AA39WEM0_9PEZI|nr:hypothetical protein B0T14DRAFT_290891 [Immersiella caudata]
MQPTFALLLKPEGYSMRPGSESLRTGERWVSGAACCGVHWPVVVVAEVISVATYTALAVWNGVAPGWKWVCYVGMGLF